MWVRKMEAADLAETAELERICFSDAWSEHILTDLLDSSMDAAYVLEDKNRIIGFVNARAIGDEGELLRIEIMPERRGEKLSRILMDRAMAYFKNHGVQDVTLEVRSQNIPAIALYEKYGFAKEGQRREYYHNPPDDALIYWKRKTER
jgi:ribosomal-protein-alanine acetyltransferase